jgi:hypothetical protein
MGSTLTSTQPKDTYKSLLKTSDTTELSATAKYVSDGNGNDSPLALSTANVGIGTSAPSTRLTVDNSADVTNRAIDIVGNGSTVKGHLGVFSDGVYLSGNYYFDGAHNNDVSGLGQTLIVMQSAAGSASNILFRTSAAGSTTTTTRASIDADGLKFGSDTAAANALDDYEEGTFTPSLGDDATYLAQSGTYTKIGRVVTFKALVYVNVIGTGSTTTISGLPFAIAADGGAVCLAPSYSGLATSVSSVNGNVVSTSIAIQSNVGNAATNQTLNAIFQNSTYLEIAGTYQV